MADIKITKNFPETKSEKPTKTEPEVKAAVTTPATSTTSVAAKVPDAEKAPAAKPGRKPGAKKANAGAKKTATKKAAPTGAKGKKGASKKTAAAEKTPAPRTRKKKEPVDVTEVVKGELWKALSKTKAKKISGVVAIEVWAEGIDCFYIAVKDGQPEIERYPYHGNNGVLKTSEAELKKIAKGKYDFVSAAKSDKINFDFDGQLSAFLKLIDLF